MTVDSSPMKVNSAVQSMMNTRSPDSPGSEPILQEALKAVMKQELRGATWESHSIVQLLLPHDANVVAEVHKSVGDAVKRGQNGWPNSSGEREHYPPFAKLLNDTFRAAQHVLGSNAGSYYNSLRFSTYDRETADGIDGAHALKPDLVGCDEDIPSSRKNFWLQVHRSGVVHDWRVHVLNPFFIVSPSLDCVVVLLPYSYLLRKMCSLSIFLYDDFIAASDIG